MSRTKRLPVAVRLDMARFVAGGLPLRGRYRRRPPADLPGLPWRRNIAIVPS